MRNRPWQLADDLLITPIGRQIPLRDVLDWSQATNQGRQSILTPTWQGWRVIQQWLVPPGRNARSGGIPLQSVRHLALELDHYRKHGTFDVTQIRPEQLRLALEG